MKILFWLRSRKTQKIIHVRVTTTDALNFSTGIAVLPHLWLGSDNLINPLNKILIGQNNTLSQIKAELIRAYNDLTAERRTPTAAMVIDRYNNNRQQYNPVVIEKTIPTISEILGCMLESKKTELDLGVIEESTYKRYERFEERFVEYLAYCKITLAADITKIDETLLNNFLRWMIQTKDYVPAYINKHRDFIILLRNTCLKKQNNEWKVNWLMKDILKLKVEEPKLVFIQPEEISQIRNSVMIGVLEKVKDMFLFMIETGVHIAEYRRIREIDHIDIDNDGDSWISLTRKKTKVKFDILLTTHAMEIVSKYGSLKKLPIMADQKFNDYLKILGLRCGLSVELTSKVARKTFCNLHLNEAGVRTDIVANLMGLANDRCIKHYGQINRSRIKAELKKTM